MSAWLLRRGRQMDDVPRRLARHPKVIAKAGPLAVVSRFRRVSEQSMAVWDDAATTLDHSADHGLTDPPVRAAWSELLRRALPQAPARVADLGCGTGSIAILAAELGHRVDGVDFSEQMLQKARSNRWD